ncbi:uncharacterized protein LOC108475372 [Gossypium arboreum]|uniref:uncharacterized protein LOC108475372 n=1 Tax=Gossypium arboreum TaxID=29729 RepID=UPI0008193CF3|nr:uncharacterized protein LOC108475372 [Gossypium arboreum]
MGCGQRVSSRGAGQTEVRQSTLVYVARCLEDRDTSDFIIDTFLIYDVPYFALIDIGSTHSYVANTMFGNLGILVENTSSEVTVLSPLGQFVRVSKLYGDVPLEVQRSVFLANLMELLFWGFDLILVAEKLIRKECETFLAYISVSVFGDFIVKDIRTTRDFLNVFFKELSGLPPNREVEFGIELLSSTAPVSIAPYRMAPKKLTELKAQLQELLDRGFICPSVSVGSTCAVC